MLRGRRIVALLTFSIDRRSPVELMGLILVTALAAFAFSSYGHLVTAPTPICCRFMFPHFCVSRILDSRPLEAKSSAFTVHSFCSLRR